MGNEDISTSPSLKHKLKRTLCLSCSLLTNRRESLVSPSSFSPSSDGSPRLIRASSLWLKSRAHELPEIRDRCKHLISRIGKHRRHASTDFRYDPSSYALNFDDERDLGGGEDSPRDFSSRLPASPPPPQRKAAAVVDAVVVEPSSPVSVRREIKVFS